MYKNFTRILRPTRYSPLRHASDNARMRQLIMRINLLSLLLLLGIVQVSANGFAQQVTIQQRNMALQEVFKEIRKQTGYTVLWQPKVLNDQKTINARFRNASLDEVMERCLKGVDVTYTLEDRTIVIRKKPVKLLDKVSSFFTLPVNIKGKVVDAEGRPLAGASIRVKGGGPSTLAGADGSFTLNGIPSDAILVVSYLGYHTREVPVGDGLNTITLELSDSKLDDVQIIGYGEANRRTFTGNATKVEGAELSQAPIANPISALEGRVPGMIVNQTNGTPGSAVSIQIRGRTRIDQTYGADESPLFIIDGVPMASGNDNLNQLTSAISGVGLSGLSPFSTVNTGDIESIEVLKDADATAIYGSRGANGVVLITTKKGKIGSPRINLKAVTGISKAQIPDLLNTSEYVTMRKEAFRNDASEGIEMTEKNAYDILVWDTTRTGLAEELIGGTAQYTTIEGSISGGSELTTYNVGGSYYRETNVYPKPVPNTRGNAHVSLSTKSTNKKFSADFRGTYAYAHHRAPGSDLSSKLTLAPNYKLYNEDGSLAWNEGGIITDNPLAYILQTYSAKTTNLNANAVLGYQITHELNFKTSIGYNTVGTDEIRNTPKASMNPTKDDPSFSSFGNNNFNSWIVEPQLNYNRLIGPGKLHVLLGGTLQSEKRDSRRFTVRDYPGDEFLGTLIGVTEFTNPSSADSEYKYAALFGRATYNWNDTYIVNISGRRDGSSRFGPNYRYSTFGAIGAAWIFTKEAFFKSDILSFGKLRASYGTTGNDKIGDYKYIDLYESDVWGPTYNGDLALSPTSLFKPDLHWEMNKKLEVAMDLGFLNDRFLVGLAWYRNRSNDPLVQYPLPYNTGFTSVVANLKDVIVQNQGLEITWDSHNIETPDFEWRTAFNITFPQNKLIAYPGLEQSSYAKKYVIGENLDLVYIANFIGVNPETGLYEVEDLNGDSKLNVVNLGGDLAADFDSEPAFYGGFKNDFRYKNFALSLFFNFNKQWTRNWRTIPGTNSPGYLNTGTAVGNMPRYVLNRWQQPGDVTDVQKFTTKQYSSSSLIGTSAAYYSDVTYENIFYTRLRTAELLYNIPTNWLKKAGIGGANVFVQAQNLFTISPFRGTDPQTVFIHSLAPLRTFVAGVQLNF